MRFALQTGSARIWYYFPAMAFCVWLQDGFSQKYNYYNYSVPQGLVQSQVTGICQDRQDNLWFSTLGGISKFDGKKFTNYTETNGLVNIFTNCIVPDPRGNIWVGTQAGLSCFNGLGFKNFRFGAGSWDNYVRAVVPDRSDGVYVLGGLKLFRISDRMERRQIVVSGLSDSVSAIASDGAGHIWAVLFRKGVYMLQNDRWVKKTNLSTIFKNEYFRQIIFDPDSASGFYLLGSRVLVRVRNAGMADTSMIPRPAENSYYQSFVIDKGTNWITSSAGLFKIINGSLEPVTAQKGFSDNVTTSVFGDREGNTWFGTNGAGAYRYSFEPFLVYDQFTNVHNSMVIRILGEIGKPVYLATDGNGLFRSDGKSFTAIPLPIERQIDKHISGISAGYHDDMYVWTAGGAIWRYVDNHFELKIMPTERSCLNTALSDEKGYWTGDCMGTEFHPDGGLPVRLTNTSTFRLFRISKDTLLASTVSGFYSIVNRQHLTEFDDPRIGRSKIMDIKSFGPYYLIATANLGFLIYDTRSREVRQYTSRDGLNSDFIYSVTVDHARHIWLGTGRGVNMLTTDSRSSEIKIHNYSGDDNLSASECNQGAAFCDDANHIWFGTNAGLIQYMPDSFEKSAYVPPIVLQSVKVASKEMLNARNRDSFSLLRLGPGQNNISFRFGSAAYRNLNRLQYQYKLEGMDVKYTDLTPVNDVVYQSLPPGDYHFRVRSYLAGAGYSPNTIDYPFHIAAPFYKKSWFEALLIVMVFASGTGLHYLRILRRTRRRQEIEKIREAENQKVRARTAEDFHDEIGNKLASIQMLAGLLHAKSEMCSVESQWQLGKIKEDVNSLYRGTRDILWALRPESDNLMEIGDRIGNFGIELFQGMDTAFEYRNEMDSRVQTKVNTEYGRNLLMIFKEAITNILKHAEASQVWFTVSRESRVIRFTLSDNGKGFDVQEVARGNGIDNILSRAKRINARLELFSEPGGGTRYIVEMEVPD